MPEEKKKTVVPRLRFPEFRDADPWEVKKIEEHFEVSSSRRVLQKDWQASGVPFYRTRELVALYNNEPFNSEVYISEELFHNLAREYGLPSEGDFLVSGVGTLGIIYQVQDGDRFYFKDGNVLWFKRKGGVLSSFFKYSFESDQVQQQILSRSSVSTVGTYTIKDAKQTVFACPPDEYEQQKIADFLTSLDDLISAEEERLEALKQHKKGLMQQLFPREGETTPRLRFPEFRDAGPWEVKRLGEVISLEYGASLPESQRIEGPFPVVGSNGVVGYHHKPMIEGPAIIIGRKGSAGEINWVDSACFPIDTTYYVVLKTPTDRLKFLKLLLEQHRLSDLINPSGVPGLNRDDVYALKTAIPSPPEQQKIADFLTSLDDLISAEEERLEALKQHKKGLMQQLFPSLDEVRR